MQFDWTTFILELLNFLVLLWLLKHFFYRPVLAVLDARRQGILDMTERAEGVRREAEAAKARYEAQLASWGQEQERQRHALAEELVQERARQLDGLKKALADETARAGARTKALEEQKEAQLMRQARSGAYAAASAMLGRLAGPALTARIVTMVVEDLAALPEEQRAMLRNAAAASGAAVDIGCAHPLEEASLASLTRALEAVAGKSLQPSVKLRPGLIAGVHIAIGDRSLMASLAEELAYFRDGAPAHG